MLLCLLGRRDEYEGTYNRQMSNAGDGDQEDQCCWTVDTIEFYLIDPTQMKISWNGWRRWSGAVGISGSTDEKEKKERKERGVGKRARATDDRQKGSKKRRSGRPMDRAQGREDGQKLQETGLHRLRYAKCI